MLVQRNVKREKKNHNNKVNFVDQTFMGLSSHSQPAESCSAVVNVERHRPTAEIQGQNRCWLLAQLPVGLR